MRGLLISAIVLILLGCTPDRTAESAEGGVLTAFLQREITRLTAAQTSVLKDARLDGKTETHVLKEINWKKELDVFVQADVEKPALRTNYDVTQPNAQTKVWTLKSDLHLPVERVLVETAPGSTEVVRMEAQMRSKNFLYDTTKKLSFTTRSGPNRKRQLTAYEVVGSQKPMFGREMVFQIAGRIQ